MRQVTDEDRYRFDLQGYLVIPGALSADEVAEVNRLIDLNAPALKPGEHHQGLWGILSWSEAFRRMLDHPNVLPYLMEWIDPTLRCDLVYGVVHHEGSAQLDLHLGGTPYHPMVTYQFRNGRPYTALTVVAWALTDVPAGAGGFACIPGSHKSNYESPPDVKTFERRPDYLCQPELKAGDAVLFTESCTHGTLPWVHTSERRVLFYRYTPGTMLFEPMDIESEVLEAATPTQRRLLEPPYARTPVFTEEGRITQKSREPVLEPDR